MALMKIVGSDQAGNMTAAKEVLEYRRGDFLISTDRSRLDLDVVHGFLTKCYWAKGIPKEVVARSIQHSLCFGMYHAEKQAGFCSCDFRLCDLCLSRRCVCTGTIPRSQPGQVDDAVHHGTPLSARVAALEPAYARCPRSLR